MKNNKGLTFLEVILAITLLAMVLGGGLILIGHNMIIMKKASELMVSTALTQYAIQDARNMDFPPVYYNRLYNEINNEFITGSPYTYEFISSPQYANPFKYPNDGRNMTPPKYFDDWTVERYIIAYGSSGNILLPPTPPTTQAQISNYENSAMELEVIVYVIQNKSDDIVSQDITYMSRNGTF